MVWEISKRRYQDSSSKEKPKLSARQRIVKLVKILALLFIVVQTLLLNVLPILDDPLLLQIVGTTIYVVGLTMAIVGRLQLGINWANFEDYQVLESQSLVTTGIYRYVRHPIYAGDLLLLLGLELALNSWLVVGVVALFFIVLRQVKAEELVMSRAFPEYSAYQEKTKKFIPYVV
jgi:protein-S-isoprenylcysteine O-methyltransferase Ste14